MRDGSVVPIPSAEVTVGDIVMLDAGDYIPADGRLLESASLKVDESALTGESLGVEKMTDAIEGEVPLGDRTNMVYSGSFVTYGRGSFVVTGIGMETEVGKIASLLKTTSEKKTPLQVNLDQFGQKLSIIILVFCGILFGINVFRGGNIGDAFLFAVALAVAAIPGGTQFHRNNRTFFRYPEDGERTCDHPKTAGSRGSGKCFYYLF